MCLVIVHKDRSWKNDVAGFRDHDKQIYLSAMYPESNDTHAVMLIKSFDYSTTGSNIQD